jgi:hypothetical protein
LRHFGSPGYDARPVETLPDTLNGSPCVGKRLQGFVVLARFRRRSGIRTLVAAAAAYAFSLQLLLAGIVVTQMTVGASADPFAICLGDPNSPDGSHGGTDPHAVHQACAICTFASAAPLLSAIGHPVPLAIETAAFHPAAVTPAVAVSRHNPRSSQGPPLNV